MSAVGRDRTSERAVAAALRVRTVEPSTTLHPMTTWRSIDAASFARGEKVWFREMTGIKPLKIADVVNSNLIDAARKAYPG